jgi:hypothetical protein
LKKILIFLLFVPLVVSAQNSFWKLQKDSMNLAILMLDYQTYKFQGACFSIHKPCKDCDKDSLPFKVKFNTPGDFGDVTFLYTETKDTIFFGEIHWDGIGSIKIPSIFFNPSLFKFVSDTIPPPISKQYFENYYVPDPDNLQSKIDSAWNAIKQLDIVSSFSKNIYRIGIYFYPPAIGEFRPEYAKWIIFLYQGKVSPDFVEDNNSNLNNQITFAYPNPAITSTTINYSLDNPSIVIIDIYNSLGSKIANIMNEFQPAGEQKAVFDGTNYPSGVYYYTLRIGGKFESGKMVLVR